MIALRPDAVEVAEANEETEVEYPSDRFEDVRDKDSSVPRSGGWSGKEELFGVPPSVDRRVEERSRCPARKAAGTSCTCRFNGWFDLDGGGRTTMNV